VADPIDESAATPPGGAAVPAGTAVAAGTAAILLGSAATDAAPTGCRCRGCLAAPAGRPACAARLQVSALTVSGATITVSGGDPVGIRAGSAIERDGVRVIGLPAAGGEVALVLGSPAGTVLWAPTAGPLPEPSLAALAGAGLDVAVLALGDCATASTGLARTLARLRRADAVAADCDVVAVEVRHGDDTTRLGPLLAGWGARIAPDGAPLGPAHAAPPRPALARTLLLGPASSGKSALAEAMLAAEPDVDYLPTGPAPTADDADWAARIEAHRRRRPPWWSTLEGADLAGRLGADGPPLLVDSLGTWVAEALQRCGAWDDAPRWRDRYDAEVRAVVQGWRQVGRRVVAVGEETGWGVIPSTSSGRRFREALGGLTQQLAAESERVLLVVAGRTVDLGGPDLPSGGAR